MDASVTAVGHCKYPVSFLVSEKEAGSRERPRLSSRKGNLE